MFVSFLQLVLRISLEASIPIIGKLLPLEKKFNLYYVISTPFLLKVNAPNETI